MSCHRSLALWWLNQSKTRASSSDTTYCPAMQPKRESELGFWNFKVNLEPQGLSNNKQVICSKRFKRSVEIRYKNVRK